MTQLDKNRSLTVAIIITIITAVLFSFLFLFLGINHRKNVYDDSKQLAVEISRNAAFTTQVYFSSATEVAKSLGQRARLVKRLNGPRSEIHDILKSTINEKENYLGVWTLWEPDAFDQKDDLYRKNNLYNDTGSVGFAYFRYKDSLYYEIMHPAEYEMAYYREPKKLQKEILTDPYWFRYSGYEHRFFGASISIPIVQDEIFLGVIGIDIDLNDLQNQLNKIQPYETGYLSLISQSGLIISHMDSSMVAKNFFDVLNSKDTISRNAIKQGKERIIEKKSDFTGEKVLQMFYPIDMELDGKTWSMMIEIPLDKAIYRSKQLLAIALITLFVGLSLLSYLIKNILERKKYEKELLAAKNKAEESNRLKTAFLNNISHEIRTPLNGIMGFAELLASSVPSNDEIQLYKKMMLDSSNQLLTTMTNVIELSKIQSQQAKLNVGEFKIADVLNKTYESYINDAQKKGIKLLKNAPADLLDHTIISDKEKLLQIFTYLLNNAFKFTEQGTIELGCNFENDAYRFFVKDTGIGIKPEFKKTIFNYFTQGDPSSKRYYDGLGVGLSISKSFVHMLGGKIWLESEIDAGSTFYFSLPAQNKNA